MRGLKASLTWLWASLAIIGGVGALVAIDLLEDPDSSLFDVALNLLEELPLVVIAAGAVVLYQTLRRQRDENDRIVRDLQIARTEGEHWRSQTQTHLKGLGDAIDRQFTQWSLTAAERDVALLLLKGLTSKEIATLRNTSDRTVREQARSVYMKARLPGRAGLSAYFLEDLLVPADDSETSPVT